MGDTSERSQTPSLPPRCPCGFWGSSETMNLCSKCFADIQKKPPGDDCASEHIPSSGSPSPVFTSETSGPSLTSSAASTSEPPSTEPPSISSCREGSSPTDTTHLTGCTSTKRPRESDVESERPPLKLRCREEPVGGSEELPHTAKQKNRRRCFRCQTKLELVQQELGSCRCGYVFCLLHRLPEQHDCLFDHLGRGRQEAVMKMVKLERKVGRSCQRIGEECS
ncbi:AN1-type zinc finger protein 3 homolog [Synchiropus picturatus]